MRIRVYQHVFSNVPKDQSPWGRRGYQTLYYTQDGISREDLNVLEQRAQYYSSDQEPVKWQFYTLASGKAVISHIVPLAEPDEFGRKGRYLAHSFVISSGDFSALDYCPMGLFDHQNRFVSNLAQVQAQGNRETGDLPALNLVIDETWQDRALSFARAWDPGHLQCLAQLGWRAGYLKEQRQMVALEGEAGRVLGAIAVAFLLTAPDKRPLLTFDTFAHGCDWSRDWPFWACGGLGKESEQAPYRIDPTKGQVVGTPPNRALTPFEHWMMAVALPERLEHYLAYQTDALYLSNSLEGKVSRQRQVAPEFAKRFMQLNAAGVIALVLDRLPAGLSPPILDCITDDVKNEPWEYFQWALSAGPGEIAEVLFNLLVARAGLILTKQDEKVLHTIAETAGDSRLKGLILLQTDNTSGWEQHLQGLSRQDYRTQIRLLLEQRRISASDAFSPQHFSDWCAEAGPYLQPGEIKLALSRLKKVRGELRLDHLAPLVPQMAPIDRSELADWLQGYKGPAVKLRAHLGIEETEQTSVGERIKSFLREKPGKKRGRKK